LQKSAGDKKPQNYSANNEKLKWPRFSSVGGFIAGAMTQRGVFVL